MGSTPLLELCFLVLTGALEGPAGNPQGRWARLNSAAAASFLQKALAPVDALHAKIWRTLRGHLVRAKFRVLSMLVLSLALLGGCGSGNDYGGQRGYDYLPRCQLVVRGPRTDREIATATYCVGAVTALTGVAPLLAPRYRFCFPDDVTAGEAVQVVVAYLESNLSRLEDDFRQLAIAAMRQAWPCR